MDFRLFGFENRKRKTTYLVSYILLGGFFLFCVSLSKLTYFIGDFHFICCVDSRHPWPDFYVPDASSKNFSDLLSMKMDTMQKYSTKIYKGQATYNGYIKKCSLKDKNNQHDWMAMTVFYYFNSGFIALNKTTGSFVLQWHFTEPFLSEIIPLARERVSDPRGVRNRGTGSCLRQYQQISFLHHPLQK